MHEENDQAIAFNITEYPQHLLVPPIKNLFSFQITNTSKSPEVFILNISAENLDVKNYDLKEQEIKLNPSENKNISLNLLPKKDGKGKLIITLSRIKEVEYTTKVQKIREISKNEDPLNILKTYKIKIPNYDHSNNPEDFIMGQSKRDIKKLERELHEKIDLLKKSDSLEEKVQKPSDNEIENLKKKLIKAYVNDEKISKALDLIKDFSNRKKRKELKFNAINAYGTLNLRHAIEVALKVFKEKRSLELIPKIFDKNILKQPEQGIVIIKNVHQNELRKDLITIFFEKIKDDNLNLILTNLDLIKNDSFKIKLLYNILKNLVSKEGTKEKENKILNRIITICLSKKEVEKKNSNEFYTYLRDAIHLEAILFSPKASDKIIQNLEKSEVIEDIAMDLFDVIYEMVDEVRIKKEPVQILSHFYLFNTIISDKSKEIEKFAQMGGNISSNILLGKSSFNKIFVSLFKHEFSLYPTLDRLFNDLHFENENSFGYYILPSETFDEKEFHIIEKTSEKLIKAKLNSKIRDYVIINFDFISYLGEPAVFIVTKDEKLTQKMQEKLKTIQGKVNIFYNSNFFKNGDLTEILEIIYPPSSYQLINIVLSFEFLNNYKILKNLIQLIV